MESVKYSKIEKIYENNNTVVYKALNLETKKVVAYKTIKNINFNSNVYGEMLKKEYGLLSHFDSDHIVKPIEFVEDREIALVTEFINGKTLSEIIAKNQLSFDEKIVLTLEILDALKEIHNFNVLHKDINPTNLIWDFEKKRIVVVDFNISEKIVSQKVGFVGERHLQGTLPYISPEQTGRMNRDIDYRSDYYSLGITLYELFLGEKPFKSEGFIEMVHSHIAIEADDPISVDPEFNKVIAKVIMKLISKNVENRYQSIDGIIYDVKLAQEKDLDISSFVAGKNDELGRLNISQKLYGRERVVEELLSGFINVIDGGFECRFINGYSGVGKTSVVNELHRPITNISGYFLSGKYDKYNLATPYSGIIQAISDFIDLILLEGGDNLLRWTEKFEEELGPYCSLLVEFIPKLELVIGKKERYVEVSAIESQNRFNTAIQKFLFMLADKEHPVVLFLDDIQWIDSASLKLMESMIENQNLDYFYLLCAYRINEVKSSHMLNTFFAKLENSYQNIEHYALEGLKDIDLRHFLRDSFDGIQDVDVIIQKIMEKTDGNAFYIKKMIMHFYEEGCIYYLFDEKRWEFDKNCFDNLEVFENVGEFLASELKAINEKELEILKYIAHMGKTFDIRIVDMIFNEIDIDVEYYIRELQEHGYILSLGSLKYMFAHDQIKQSAYQISNEEEKNNIRLKIADALIKMYGPNYSDEIVFEIANQFRNMDLNHKFEHDVYEIIEILIRAGDISTKNIAFEMAKEYYMNALSLINEKMWLDNYQVMLELKNKIIENAYLLGEFDELDKGVEDLKIRVKDPLELGPAYEAQIQSYMARQMYQEGLSTMLLALKDFDMELALDVSDADHKKAFEELAILMKDRDISSLVNLKVMDDKRYISILRMLTAVLPLLFNAAPQLLPIVVIDMVKISIIHGNSIYSPFAYTFFGTILCAIIGDVENGKSYGEIAIKLIDKLNAKSELPKTYMITSQHVLHYEMHLDKVIEMEKEAFYTGIEIGDLTYAGFAGHGYCFNYYLAGKELLETKEVFETYSEIMDEINQGTQNLFQKLYIQAISNLIYKEDEQWILEGEWFNENEMLESIKKSGHKTALFILYFLKMQIAYIFNKYDEALEASEFMAENLDGGFGLMHVPIYYQFKSLILLSKYNEMDSKEKHNTLKIVYENQKYLENLSDGINYKHRYLIVEAEIARVTSNYKLARELYEEALEIVKSSNYIHEEAIYREIIYRYYNETGNHEFINYYKNTSMLAYKEWGAMMKYKSFKIENNDFETQKFDKSIYTVNSLDTEFVNSKNINLSSILKFSQVMSSEIVYDELLKKLINILIENSGATKATIINYSKDNSLVLATSSTGGEFNLELYDSLDACEDIPKTLVNYVYNTRKIVRIDNAIDDSLFGEDEYISSNSLKSLICFPLINKRELIGIIYLENKLTKDVFLKEHVDFLSLLSTQIAVSIENASLYRHLEMLVDERTQELELKNQELIKVNRKLELLSITDNLTGLLNRRRLDEVLEYEYAKSVRYSSLFSVILLDLDGFKRVNDSFGHEVGDDVLIKVADLLRSNTRKIDIVGRWGGEEFLIICPEIGSDETFKLAEKLRIILESTTFEYIINQTASFGVSTIKLYESIKDIVKRADDNLYIAKNEGRNKVVK